MDADDIRKLVKKGSMLRLKCSNCNKYSLIWAKFYEGWYICKHCQFKNEK